MIIKYGSFSYFLYIFLAISLCLGAYFILRGKSRKIQKTAVITLMLLNVFQHLFKPVLYPQYFGMGFSSLSTAYNMCAFLIIFLPIVFLWGPNFLRDFFLFVGAAAGIVAIALPYWHIGEYAFTAEAIRFYICHALLFAEGLLPLLLGLHKPSYKNFHLMGLAFLLSLGVIILNNAICISLGIYPGTEGMTVGEGLRFSNPLWSFGEVPEGFSWIISIAKFFLPDSWVGENPGGHFVPVVWYAIPVYIGITVIAAPVFILFDKKRFLIERDKKNEKRRGKIG